MSCQDKMPMPNYKSLSRRWWTYMGVCSMLNNISWEKDTAAVVTVSYLYININVRRQCVVYSAGVIL